ncbi:MAG TPA: DoxX family protein [Acidobacteriota bacterium]|nr:DoxX family protein [Acidobacteriota bacterium]
MNLRAALETFDHLASSLQTPLLFVLRVYWGWSFAQTGWGKLMHLDRTAEFFASLNLPMPKLNAIAAGATECVGGALLALGLFARPASVPLIVTMLVAYVTADRDALQALFSDPDKFFSAAPFLFLFASLLVLAFGPGKWSLDHLRRRGGEGVGHAGGAARSSLS